MAEIDLRVSTLFSFSNHAVLITGGTSGLGEMAAKSFVQNGARVIIASRKECGLKRCTDTLNTIGPGKCEYIVADLKDKAGSDHLSTEVKKRTDNLTVLLNNAGATWGAAYDDFPEAAWDEVMAVNVKAIFDLTVDGGFPSQMTEFAIQNFPEVLLASQPAGRIGKPEDFACLVLFLCSYSAAYMTGNVIEIDGGSVRSGWNNVWRSPKPVRNS